MTESVAMEEYETMVAEGIQRQKTMEKQVNNNIRGNYMDRLGVKDGMSVPLYNTSLRDSAAESRSSRPSN